MKRMCLWLLVGTLVIIGGLYAKRRLLAHLLEPAMILPITPENSIFAFDLHGVVLQPNYGQLAHLFATQFLPNAPWHLMINPVMWYKFFTMPYYAISNRKKL